MYQFQQINKANIHLVENFLSVLGDGVNSFRYYSKRAVNVALLHKVTVVMVDEQNLPVAYGHLDKEGDKLWVGLAVGEKKQGLGLGKKMLQYLINYAKEKQEQQLTLTVDKTNNRAINLYKSHGFECIEEKEHYYRLVLIIE